MANRRTGRLERQMQNAHEQRQHQRRKAAIIYDLLLFVGTLALYSPVRTHEFINYDDPTYILNNPHVTQGLDWRTIQWSFTTAYASNWHPVTWMSHALDWQLFGPDAGFHHETSALLHALNGILLFVALFWATQDEVPSFVVAALFSWHPFNVESVAWAAERKTLLCMLFSLLTILAYLWYAQARRWSRFAVVLAGFALALASKPMAVTLPFLLLLWDYWPLQRISGWTGSDAGSSFPPHSIVATLIEKIPMLALSAASCIVTVWAQRAGGALKSLKQFPMGARLENAIDSYVIYIAKTVWPSGFGLFYPHPGSALPLWKPLIALVFMLAASVGVWLQRSSRPYLLVGWLWFLGTLVPVIGVVQVGDQAMADRYAYLPVIGLFVMLVWGAYDLAGRLRVKPAFLSTISLVLLACCWLSFQQIGYWRNNLEVWSHTLEVTSKNGVAENQLGFAFMENHNIEQAIAHYRSAVDIDSDRIDARVNLGVIYASQGRLEEGIQQLDAALRLSDGKDLSDENQAYRSSAQLNLAFAELLSGRYSEALIDMRKADQMASSLLNRTLQGVRNSLASAPSEPAYLRLALLACTRGKEKEAAALLGQVVAENPGYDRCRQFLSFLKTNHE